MSLFLLGLFFDFWLVHQDCNRMYCRSCRYQGPYDIFWLFELSTIWKNQACGSNASDLWFFFTYDSEIIFRPDKWVLNELDDVNLFTTESNILHRIAEDLWKFGDVGQRDGFRFEHFDYLIDSYLKLISVGNRITFEKSVQAMRVSRDLFRWKMRELFVNDDGGWREKGFVSV